MTSDESKVKNAEDVDEVITTRETSTKETGIYITGLSELSHTRAKFYVHLAAKNGSKNILSRQDAQDYLTEAHQGKKAAEQEIDAFMNSAREFVKAYQILPDDIKLSYTFTL